VEIEGDRIAAVGSGPRPGCRDLGHVVILPSLVNAHTHLELSYLERAIPRSTTFIEWIRGIMSARRRFPDASDPAILSAARRGIEQSRAAGTGLVGDVSNTLVTVPLLQSAGMPGRVFYELLGFNEPAPESRVAAARTALDTACRQTGIRGSLAPHAPYSVSPALLAAIRRDLDAHPGDISTVHIAESREEVTFLETGNGGWKDLLRELGVWNERWRTPGVSPMTYLTQSGFVDSRVLMVHCVHCNGSDLSHVIHAGATIVACPRSNRHVGAGDPPLAMFYESGARVAFGTDSLASADDLNVFGELAAARRLAPGVPARRLLESATLQGACALGFGGDFGSVDPGKQASLIAVRLQAPVIDVEEYLLTGIQPDAISWLDS
jgi:cytosine/adenosine deaminase-related metal-dependent hydrolase